MNAKMAILGSFWALVAQCLRFWVTDQKVGFITTKMPVLDSCSKPLTLYAPGTPCHVRPCALTLTSLQAWIISLYCNVYVTNRLSFESSPIMLWDHSLIHNLSRVPGPLVDTPSAHSTGLVQGTGMAMSIEPSLFAFLCIF